MEGWLRWIGIRRLYSAQYVGGLNASGAPHGIGVWMDSYRHGEFLVGCVPCPVPVQSLEDDNQGMMYCI